MIRYWWTRLLEYVGLANNEDTSDFQEADIRESEHVPFPLFEFVGPPCQEPGCQGVLIDTYSLKERLIFKKCSVCHKQYSLTSEGKLETDK